MVKVGIIGAMELEVEELKAGMAVENIVEKAGMSFYEGVLCGVKAVVVRCGVGKVNAALCVQILADCFGVTHIINTGVAGSLNPALDIGDILISREALHHDVDATLFGYQPGEVPQLGIREFPADGRLAALAKEACVATNPDIRAVIGRVLSGDQFISDDTVKSNLQKCFRGDCTEMEGAAIAHGAYLNKIPFVIIRAISDKADHTSEVEYPVFEKAAAKHSAKLVARMLPRI